MHNTLFLEKFLKIIFKPLTLIWHLFALFKPGFPKLIFIPANFFIELLKMTPLYYILFIERQEIRLKNMVLGLGVQKPFDYRVIHQKSLTSCPLQTPEYLVSIKNSR